MLTLRTSYTPTGPSATTSNTSTATSEVKTTGAKPQANGSSLDPAVIEYSSLQDAFEPFLRIITDEVPSTRSTVKLCCSLPSYEEWSSETNLDIHDLYDLHARLILFLRTAVQRLRASKIFATYHLSPCQSSSAPAGFAAIKVTISTPSPSSSSQIPQISSFSAASLSSSASSPTNSAPPSPVMRTVVAAGGNTSPRVSTVTPGNLYSSLALVGGNGTRSRSGSASASGGLGGVSGGAGAGAGAWGKERACVVRISSVDGAPVLITS